MAPVAAILAAQRDALALVLAGIRILAAVAQLCGEGNGGIRYALYMCANSFVAQLTLVAEHASPSRAAVALPGRLAVAVDAAGIGEALVALGTSPAHLAAAMQMHN